MGTGWNLTVCQSQALSDRPSRWISVHRQSACVIRSRPVSTPKKNNRRHSVRKGLFTAMPARAGYGLTALLGIINTIHVIFGQQNDDTKQ
jgi:hypothetical protein